MAECLASQHGLSSHAQKGRNWDGLNLGMARTIKSNKGKGKVMSYEDLQDLLLYSRVNVNLRWFCI
jgi:hypothetical protein